VTAVPLHVRRGDAERHARRRCAQSERQHPLAVDCACGDRGGATLRSTVRRPFPGARIRGALAKASWNLRMLPWSQAMKKWQPIFPSLISWTT
jgi:hypothetical protein